MRDRWSSRMIFLFAAIGSAVGLGNIWRFPYLTYKYGGGAFLIPYLIALLVLGIPLLILEFGLGQKIQKGAMDAFKHLNPKLQGIGLGAVISGFVVVVYYAAVMAWALIYFIKSFNLKLPWAEDSSGYFFNNVLQLSEGVHAIGGINWAVLLALAVVWLLVYFCVFKGVKSVGKVVAVTMPLPIILLVILFIRGITLDGAFTGILYYLKPNFAALLDWELWTAATSQIFFTLSLAFGIMIAYASYKKETEDVVKDSYTTALVNSGISLFAGFVVFSVLGYMTTVTGASIADVATAGPGLAFVVFPQALSLMPMAWLFAIMFFLTLLSLGIDSAFSLVEAVTTVIRDKVKNISKNQVAMLVCFIAFVLGTLFATKAGLYFLDIADHFVTNFTLVIVGLFECIAVGWLYGAEKMRRYVNSVSDWKVGRWWNAAIKYVIPVALIALLVNQFIIDIKNPYEGYVEWALALGWLIVIVPVVIALILAIRPYKKTKQAEEG